MSLRPVLAIAAAGILAATSGYLVKLELSSGDDGLNRIAQSEATTRHSAAARDPLFDLAFMPGDREDNLVAMGMPARMVEDTLKEMRRLEDQHRKRLELLVRGPDDPQDLADALCGRTNDVRPRYGALGFLVEIKGGERMPVDPRRLSALTRQEWSRTALIEAVYREVELGDGRPQDAPIMTIAAILLGQEQAVLDGFAPWGNPLTGTWSWDRVVSENPGIEGKVIRYFALMHIVTEIAQGEGGICGE